jgi:hypothetical protein
MSRVRTVFALLGFGAALLGIAFGDTRITWLAMALLAISLVVRLIMRKLGNHHG